MYRLYPAEIRLKEGANARDSEQTGGSVPLPRVGGALSARFRQYQGTSAAVSNAVKLGEPSHKNSGRLTGQTGNQRTNTRN